MKIGFTDIFVSLAAVLVLSVPVSAWSLEPVGHVLMAVGQVVRMDSEGKLHALGDKQPVFEGDTLQTAEGARAQLKMVDNALLVLQSETSVVISRYQFDPSAPEGNAARIDLVKGRLRSVTGDLGEANHDAFRLNTPIAAIGIRGTDFETTSSDEVTRVRLNSGAVVISALGDDCSASALGPCESGNSLLLTEGLDSPVAELRAADRIPRIIDLPDYESDDQSSTLDEQKEKEKVGSQKQVDRIADKAIRPDVEIPVIEEPKVPVVDQIFWGRWSSVSNLEGPTVEEIASSGKEILVRNDLFVLYRDGFLALSSGEVSFELDSYQAGILSGGVFTPVSIADGSLVIDFDEREFSTDLTFSGGTVAGLTLNAEGVVNSQGFLFSQQGSMSVVGGLAQGNTQAGYLFTHSLNDSMSLQGATQWQLP
jgi:hypothetical protein